MSTNNLENKKIRGSAIHHPNGDFEFTAYKEGDSVYETLKKVGDSSLSRTKGRTQSLIAHLKADANSADPAADLREQLENVLKGQYISDKLPRPTGKFLLREDNVKMAITAKGILNLSLTIDLSQTTDYVKEFYKLINQAALCLHFNNFSLRQRCIALAKSSTPSSETSA